MIKEEDALRAYARMLNRLDADELAPLLAEDFRYASQSVFAEIGSKAEYMTYISGKLASIRSSGQLVRAEMGAVQALGRLRPCVLVAQGDQEGPVALVLAEVAGDRVRRLDMCTVVPHLSTAVRSGEYPGS